MVPSTQIIQLADADATAAFAAMIGSKLVAGDVILLEGPVGAGKTHFARALIQSILMQPEDVPSPTFTLVQTYDTSKGELWHADLYRIASNTEIDELGLFEAFDSAICLVEWPDRLDQMCPQTALTIGLVAEGDAREAYLSWTDERWNGILAEVTHDV